MAFNLQDYEPVEERLRRFWDEHHGGRIVTELVVAPEGQWIVKTSVWVDANEERATSTGYAHEVVTERGVNSTSALENCETSSIGRALANLGYATKGKRPSREEMAKANWQPADTTDQEWLKTVLAAITSAEDGDALAGAGKTITYGIDHGKCTDEDRAKLGEAWKNRLAELA